MTAGFEQLATILVSSRLATVGLTTGLYHKRPLLLFEITRIRPHQINMHTLLTVK